MKMRLRFFICIFLISVSNLFGRQAIIEIINGPYNGKIDLNTHWGEVVPATKNVYTYNEFSAYLEARNAGKNSVVGDEIYEEAPEMKENFKTQSTSQSKVPKISNELKSNFKNKPVSDFKETIDKQSVPKPGVAFN